METPEPDRFDYVAWRAQFARRFLDTLAQRLPQAAAHRATILSAVPTRLTKSAHLISDEAAAVHLELGALVLETYLTLRAEVSEEALLDAIHWAFVQPDRQAILEGTRIALDHSPDPFETLVQISKDREASYFGSSFAFEHLQDDAHAHLVNIRRCVWHSFFRENEAPQLTPVFCAFDHNWIEALEPGHGINFQRPTTLGWGHEACRFWFIRREL